MPRVDAGVVRQCRELGRESLIQRVRMSPTMAVAGTGVEKGIAAEETPLRCMRQQADMRHRVARGVETFELDGASYADHVPLAQPPIDAPDARGRSRMRQDFCARRADQALVAAGMVAMFVRVEDLRDLPALRAGRVQAQLPLERIDGERFARLRAGNQVVEVAVGVTGPDAFDQHVARLTANLV